MISRVELQRLKRSAKIFTYAHNHKLQPKKEDCDTIIKYLPELIENYSQDKRKPKIINLENIDDEVKGIINRYAEFRGLKRPDLVESVLFVSSESGELSDAMVQSMEEDWVRNDPNKVRNIEHEIGDVFIMLCEVARNMDIGVIECMLNKMKSKGFEL